MGIQILNFLLFLSSNHCYNVDPYAKDSHLASICLCQNKVTNVNIASHGIPVQMLGQRLRGGMLRISLVQRKG